RWYWQVIYLPRIDEWTPVKVHELGKWIKEQCPPNSRVLTADPIFPLEVGMEAYPEYAVGRFVFHVADQMTPADRKRFRMTCQEELDRVLGQRPPDAIFRDIKAPTEDLAEYARKHHFRKLECQLVYPSKLTKPDHYELWIRDRNVSIGPVNEVQDPTDQ